MIQFTPDPNNSIGIHDLIATDYDRQVRAYNWFGHEALFGLSLEYVNPGQRLLDLGIGTGLGSALFARAGLEVYGIDGSAEMLKVCQAKGVARDLKLFDLSRTPWPYSERYFDHVVACGLFHFIRDLAPLFREVYRIINPGATFSFTVMAQSGACQGDLGRSQDPVQVSSEGVPVFIHGDAHVSRLLEDCGFSRLKALRVLAQSSDRGGNNVFVTYVTRRGR